MAKVLFEQVGSPARAVEVYEKVTAIDANNAVALDALARLRAGSGDASLALAAIETLASQATTPEAKSEQWMRAAKLLEKAGDIDAAIERYKAALDANPKNAGAADALRSAYASRGDAAAAVELIARQVSVAEGGLAKARLYGEMARLCKYKLDDDDRAEKAATQANHADPTNLDALMVLGDLAFETNRFLEATAHYELPANRADKLAPEDATRVLLRFVDALYKTGSTEKALAPMDTLLKIAPDNADALSRVARVTFDHGDPKRAHELYKGLIARFREKMMLSEEADALFRLGEAARRAGMLQQAFAPLNEAAELDSSSPEPLAALAKLYQAKGDWENVVKTKNRRLDVAQGQERYDLLLEIADIETTRLKDATRASKTYVAALEERPDDRNVLTKLMQLYSEEKDWTKLVEVVVKLSDFVDDKKQKAKYLQTAAMVTARQMGDVDGAIDFYDRVLDLDPTNTKCLDEAIALRTQKGDYQGVETLLKQKLERANDAGDRDAMLSTFVELAELYHKNLGWIGQAIDAYEAVQTMDPENRSHSDVLATLYASDPAQYLEKAVAAQRNILRQTPDRAESYKLLRRLYTEVKKADSAWCMCQALFLLNLAEPDEERFFRRMRADGPAAARSQLSVEEFQQMLLHEEADPVLSAIMTLIEPAIIAARSQTFDALGYDQSYLVDLANHPSQLARTVYYAASVLGVSLPPAFENPNDPGALGFLHAQTPSIVLGQYALTAEIPPQTAAFLAARHISYYRPGMYVRHLVPTGTGLKAWLFSAIKLISPGFPIQAELEGPVKESLAALDRSIQGPTRERLASLVSKLLGGGGSIDLKKWVAAVDMTADRAGFVLAHDLQVAGEIIKAIGDEVSTVPMAERLKDLLLYATSEPYFALRQKLGLAIDS
jgi:tetratricopeptide (TPR) repeat protein